MTINLTIPTIDINLQQPYIPTEDAFSWCVEQQVVHSNNIELYAVMFVVAAYVFIVAYGMDDIEFFNKYKNGFIYMAKLLLIAFFVIYILVIRLRIYY